MYVCMYVYVYVYIYIYTFVKPHAMHLVKLRLIYVFNTYIYL